MPYPHIAAKWGGGKPVRATVTLNKDSMQPGAVIKVVLIEDTDSGLYASDAEGSPARFIPRANISTIEYKPDVFYGMPKTTWGPADIVDPFK